MSPVRCPYCQYELELKGSKPGKFQPVCPECKQRFVLKVPAEPGGQPTTKKLSRNGSPPRSVARKSLAMPQIHGRVGQYHVSRKLGEGEIGAVYLARQGALDREVALKVLSPQLASQAQFASRLVRQAYAAAQLGHDNVARIYDIGAQHARGGDLIYFSMEFIEGRTLADVLRENGTVEAERAVGYVLQAARGLKFAHDHGLIHRAVKPNNLLLHDDGMVKVADLGLVVTGDVGPYASPEISEGEPISDGRADIYSLGCTLYEMLTGQTPIPGRTAAEAIAKAKQAPVPLLFIVMKMIAKRPQDRYPTMSDVIAALEGWVGVGSGKPNSPARQEAQILERAAERFHRSKWNSLRWFLTRAFLLLSVISIVLLALPLFGHPILAVGMVGFVLTAVVVYEILVGISHRTYLATKLRELLLDGGMGDALVFLAVAATGIVLLIALDLHWVWLVFAIGATAVAATFFSTVDGMLASERREPLAQTNHLLKEMRKRGLDENAVRQFVCRHAGRNWEEYYETLFGFEAKMLARQAWGQGMRGRLRPKFGRWREPIIHWLERKIQRRRNRRDRKMLARLEADALQAKGMDLKPATVQAWSNAKRLVKKGSVIRQTSMLRLAEAAMPSHARAAIQFNAQVRAISPDWMHDDSREADEHDANRLRGDSSARRFLPLNILLGPGVRLLLAIILIGGFALWRNKNTSSSPIDQPSSWLDSNQYAQSKAPQPLRVSNVPDWICDAAGSWNGALVGALLLVSIVFSGNLLGLMMLVSAAIGLSGPRLNFWGWINPNWFAAIAASVWWLATAIFLQVPDRQ